jgi:long-chain acyl-CoA synthetase
MNDFEGLPRRVRRRALQTPGQEALVTRERRVTYRDLWSQIGAVASFLQSRGVQRGHAVAILLENSPEYVAAYYGAFSCGGVAVGLNTSARARELRTWLAHCRATVLFADSRHPDVDELIAAAPSSMSIVTVGAPRPSTIAWSDVLQHAPHDPVDSAADDVAAIMYTSGTTGRPKGVTLTHQNLASNASSIIEYLELTAADRTMNVLPFFYTYGASVMHTHLAVGATVVLDASFAFPGQVVARMADERVTGFPGVPSTFAALLRCDLDQFDLSALRYVTQAGGAMPPPQIVRVREALPHARLFIMYGQTEATARLTYLPPERLTDKLGSVGIPIPRVEVDVRDDAGHSVPSGEIGQVCVRGPNVMKGYFEDAEATASVLQNGWLLTGDLGYRDSDGFLFLRGRRSEIIKSAGHRINPLDIEGVIAAIPEIEEVAVVGIPDAVLEETIRAFVQLRAGAMIDAMTIQRHCRQHLPLYKIPRSIQFVDQLPRTSSGKIRRWTLTEGVVPAHV